MDSSPSAPAELLDASFESCADLQELFQPLSPNLVALQLSSGLLKGRVQAWRFDGFRLNLLSTNQTLFLCGARRLEPCPFPWINQKATGPTKPKASPCRVRA